MKKLIYREHVNILKMTYFTPEYQMLLQTALQMITEIISQIWDLRFSLW